MFTGIVKEVGKVLKIVRKGSLIKIGICSDLLSRPAEVSDSIAINGVCLTVVAKEGQTIFFDAIQSSTQKTNLKRLKENTYVNLEPALCAGDKLGGHFVLGHVDAEVKLLHKTKKQEFWSLELELPAQFRKYIVNNGSVALDGISLTVKNVSSRFFSVDIIPFTYEHTNLKYKRTGEWVNVEFDYLLKQKESAR